MTRGIIAAGRVNRCRVDAGPRLPGRRSECLAKIDTRPVSPHEKRTRAALLTTVALLTATATFGHAESPQSARADASALQAYLADAARRFAIPASWIRSVMHVESAGRAHAVSPKGARGLMQIMPKTWDELRFRYALGADPLDAHDNIVAGAAYLRELRDRYGAPGFLAAYNAGPGRYEDHVTTGRPLPPETIAYVGAAVRLLNGGALLDPGSAVASVRSWSTAGLFPRPASVAPTHRDSASNFPVPAFSLSVGIDVTSTLAPRSDGLFAGTDTRSAKQ
jgi:hypothetical protein